MNKMKRLIPAILALSLVCSVFAFAEDGEDIQTIKKAVKADPAADPGKPAQWFKVLVSDSRTGRDKVRISLPISLVEVMVKFADNERHLKLDRDEIDINLAEMFAELKKLGPMMFIEVYEEDETVKIWLE
jgi:hypothetical protein